MILCYDYQRNCWIFACHDLKEEMRKVPQAFGWGIRSISCWYLVCSTGSDYYCGLSVNCYMITKDNNFKIRRICFGMPRHLKGGLVWIMFNPLKSENLTNKCVYKSGVWANKYVFLLCLIFRYLGSAWPQKIKRCHRALLGLEADHLYCWGS